MQWLYWILLQQLTEFSYVSIIKKDPACCIYLRLAKMRLPVQEVQVTFRPLHQLKSTVLCLCVERTEPAQTFNTTTGMTRCVTSPWDPFHRSSISKSEAELLILDFEAYLKASTTQMRWSFQFYTQSPTQDIKQKRDKVSCASWMDTNFLKPTLGYMA